MYLCNVYRSKAFLSTIGIFSEDPCSSQNFAIWSKKFNFIRVFACKKKILFFSYNNFKGKYFETLYQNTNETKQGNIEITLKIKYNI